MVRTIILVTLCMMLIAASSIVPVGAVVYTEDFEYEDGTAPPGWQAETGWWVENGQYAPRDMSVQWHFTRLTSTPLLREYVLEYDQIGISENHVGVLLRSVAGLGTGSQHFYLRTYLSEVGFYAVLGAPGGGAGPWNGTPSRTDVIHGKIVSRVSMLPGLPGNTWTASLHQENTGATWTGTWDHTGVEMPDAGYIGFAAGGQGDGTWAWDNVRLTYYIPEPGSMLTLLCGLGGFAGFVYRRRR